MQDDDTKQLTGVPAMLYLALWQAREMGFLKRILDELRIAHMAVYVHMDDYQPGGLITIDGEKGDYIVVAVDASTSDLAYDAAVFGKLKPAVKLLENDKNLLFGILGLLLKKKIRIKGFFKLLKFAKLVLRCI
ncbi:MAG: hypothetical protein GYA24_04080 [Candidatus Lokiarchaeota archaeon]|nr:hypothetical protein [Candidatus Lokiarchaeota archaeon]